MKFVVLLFAAVTLSLACSPRTKKLSQAEAQRELEKVQIYAWSAGGCTDRGNPECTSYEGIRCSTVQGLIKFQKDSRCAILVNAGTEAGHNPGTYSHANGYQVQFRKNPCISSFISAKYKKAGNSRWKSPSGNIYQAENNFWEVTYF